MENRVALRLGTGNSAYKSYRGASAGLGDLSDLFWKAGGYLNEEQDAEADRLLGNVERVHKEFLAAARRRVDATSEP